MAEPKPFSESLMCSLSEPELAERADRAARLQYEADKITGEAKLTAKAAKERVEKIEAERRLLLSEVRTKQGYKPVECVSQADYVRGVLETIRTDTGEVLRSRKLTPEERQKKLFPGGDVAEAATAKEDEPAPAEKAAKGGKRAKADAAPAPAY